MENQAKGEAAALHAFLKAQPGDLDDVLALPYLPAHMHRIVRIMWQTRTEERRLPPVARAPRPLGGIFFGEGPGFQARGGYDHEGEEYEGSYEGDY